MSAYERNKGKLEKVFAEVITKSYPDIDFEDLLWTTNEEFVEIGAEFYKVYWEVRGETDTPEFAEVFATEDGRFLNFHTYHYNGGAHWSDVVEDRLKAIDKNSEGL